MKELSEKELQNLHEVLLIIAKEIDRICRKNNITYCISGGSMLGAVRHKGFIPWDDDMDVAMLREEYDKFIEACRTDLSNNFILQTLETDKYYFYGFSKILLKDTYCVQHGHEKTKHQKGIYIDVFPLDNIPAKKSLQVKHARKNYLLIKLLFRKAGCKIEGKKTLKKLLAFKIIDFINLFTNFNWLKKKLDENMRLYNGKKTEKVCDLAGYYGYEKEITYRKYFEKTQYVPFENLSLPIILDYDKYLTDLYGDYMKLPPVDQRHTHSFQNLDFGPYTNS